MVKVSASKLAFVFFGGVILLFIIAPLISMTLATSWASLLDTSTDTEVLQSVWLTLRVSFITTLVFAIGAIPLAYLLARHNFPFKKLIIGLVDLPIVIPHSAAGIAILGFISRDSAIGGVASKFGLDFVGHPIGIGIAMAYVSVPFLINAARDGFESVPVRLEKAALNLGASSMRVFFTISLPLASQNVISGLVMMFARGMSEFGAVIIVAYHPMITPVLIFERFGSFGLKYARPVSVVFIAVCLLVFVGLRLMIKNKPNDENQ